MVVTASAYTLAVIAFERYYAICRPLHSRIWQTRSHAYAMIMLVWVIALVANVLMLFMYEEQIYNGNGLTCTPIYKPVYHFANQVYMTIVLLAVPLVIMTVLYGSVIRTLKLGIQLEIAAVDSVDQESECDYYAIACETIIRRSIINPLSDSSDSQFDVKRERESTVLKKSEIPRMESSLRSTHIQKSAIAKQRVIRMLIVVVIIFFCCWTPSYIWWLLLMAGDSFESLQMNIWNSDLNTFITLLTYISSCTNPITYCFLNKKFRTAIHSMFGRKKALRHHFEKVYFPVHASHMPLRKTLLNRSTKGYSLRTDSKLRICAASRPTSYARSMIDANPRQ
ncbi:7 transmembrane receptor [Dictyocaulus viviparus]|uniref:7 transmembrane receptor n=1 Tax=Dictyocaulus viviparus TaxID=29172 RepID=A0A0D8YDZ7_DICVI|nr:7 transmembrane receptor [Dictyocaulus viviparus]